VKFIKSAQQLGFRLDEIAELLALEDGAQCDDVAMLASRHLANVRARLSDLKRIECVLSTLLRACRASDDRVACPLIDALHR